MIFKNVIVHLDSIIDNLLGELIVYVLLQGLNGPFVLCYRPL